MEDLQVQIERHLLERGDWVSAYEICALFRVNERQLRAMDNLEGLCTTFAVSGDQGFKHVSLASTAEWLRFKHRLRRHGIRELCRVRDLERRRRNVTRPAAGVVWEKDTGQAILAGVAG